MSLWELAEPPVFWANAELHMRVKAVTAIIFFIGDSVGNGLRQPETGNAVPAYPVETEKES
jgi:hypothetical protein